MDKLCLPLNMTNTVEKYKVITLFYYSILGETSEMAPKLLCVDILRSPDVSKRAIQQNI